MREFPILITRGSLSPSSSLWVYEENQVLAGQKFGQNFNVSLVILGVGCLKEASG